LHAQDLSNIDADAGSGGWKKRAHAGDCKLLVMVQAL
jgi:hypothetical protein